MASFGDLSYKNRYGIPTNGTVVKGPTVYTAPVTSAPAGSYDPNLDWQSQNANLGNLFANTDYTLASQQLQDKYNLDLNGLSTSHDNTLADLLLASQRAAEDYARQSGYAGADLGRTTGRINEDYQTGTTRSNQDYTNNTNDLIRQYLRLGIAQDEGIRAAGAGEGGASDQAAQKRSENQGHDQSYIDLGHNRQLEDLLTGKNRGIEDANTAYQRLMDSLNVANSRTQQDVSTATSRENQSYQQQQDALALGFNQQGSALLNELNKANESNALYQAQLTQAKLLSAAQSGGLMTPQPAYQTVYFNGYKWHVYPDGHKVAIKS